MLPTVTNYMKVIVMAEIQETLLERFEQQRIEAAEFRHIDHIQAAYEMLDKYDFLDACARYASTIRTMAESVGALDKYNTTITLAFMSLIAERKSLTDVADVDAFIEANPDLLNRGILKSWYSDERLDSSTARRQFVLPDKVVGRAA